MIKFVVVEHMTSGDGLSLGETVVSTHDTDEAAHKEAHRLNGYWGIYGPIKQYEVEQRNE